MNEDQETPNTAPTPPPDLPQIPPAMPKAPERPSYVPPVIRISEAEAGDEDCLGVGSMAPFNSRVIAAVIDLFVVLGLMIAAYLIFPHFVSHFAQLLGLAYMVTRDSLPFLNGRSVGKTAMNLRVVTTDNQPLTEKWEPALIRNGVLLIPFFGLIELFVLLTRENKPECGRRLGDEWAKTKVIIETSKQEETPT